MHLTILYCQSIWTNAHYYALAWVILIISSRVIPGWNNCYANCLTVSMLLLGITQASVWILPLNDWDDRTPEKRRWQPLRGPQRKPTISDYTEWTKVCHKWRISTWRQPLQPLQPWPSAESRTHRWAPETNLQWEPRHLDIHRGKTPGTSGPLTLWLCCSWNKLLIRLAGGELAPRLSLVSPKVFLHSVTDGVFVPCRCRLWLAQLGTLHFQHNHRLDCTDIINWTKLDNAITKSNNEMHSADNWVLNPVILHYWHILPILILCSALLQFVLLKALYK